MPHLMRLNIQSSLSTQSLHLGLAGFPSQYARVNLHAVSKDIITRYNQLVGRELVTYVDPEAAPTSNSSGDQPKLGTQKEIPVSVGTGFFISDTGLIITAYHVVENAKAIEITTSSGLKIPAQYVRGSKPNDVALLQIPANSRPVDSRPWIPFVSSRSVDIGTDVFTMGFHGRCSRTTNQVHRRINSPMSGISDDQSRMQNNCSYTARELWWSSGHRRRFCDWCCGLLRLQ